MNELVNQSVLGVFEDYSYVYYSQPTEKFRQYYMDSFREVFDAGMSVTAEPLEITGGILLENDNGIIAGIFYLFNPLHKKSILIRMARVDPNYRRKGIHTKLHSLLDVIGNSLGKTEVWSTIHVNNRIMTDVIIDKLGYEPMMQIVCRQIVK